MARKKVSDWVEKTLAEQRVRTRSSWQRHPEVFLDIDTLILAAAERRTQLLRETIVAAINARHAPYSLTPMTLSRYMAHGASQEVKEAWQKVRTSA